VYKRQVGDYKSMEDASEKLVKDEEVHEPKQENVKVYRKYFEIFKEAYRGSREYCERLLQVE